MPDDTEHPPPEAPRELAQSPPASTEQQAIRALRDLFRAQLPLASTEQALKGLNDAFLSR
ncbi:MAG: hypothetical protein HW394_1942, partial [Acidobacteria bacterium]|nr:hypothetical protein [Acidobacteriota bacterium]